MTIPLRIIQMQQEWIMTLPKLQEWEIMTNQVPQNEQGELQGINASVGSIAAIIGPLLMTQSFSYFTGADTTFYFPGIAFTIAGVLAVGSLLIFAINLKLLRIDKPLEQ